MHTHYMYTSSVYIYISVGGGVCGLGWRDVMWVCKQEIDVRVCTCLLTAVFLICVYTDLHILAESVCVCVYI